MRHVEIAGSLAVIRLDALALNTNNVPLILLLLLLLRLLGRLIAVTARVSRNLTQRRHHGTRHGRARGRSMTPSRRRRQWIGRFGRHGCHHHIAETRPSRCERGYWEACAAAAMMFAAAGVDIVRHAASNATTRHRPALMLLLLLIDTIAHVAPIRAGRSRASATDAKVSTTVDGKVGNCQGTSVRASSSRARLGC